MKFAQQLNNDVVPEWKVQYLDYKVGKKKLKKITAQAAEAGSLCSRTGVASRGPAHPFSVPPSIATADRSPRQADGESIDSENPLAAFESLQSGHADNQVRASPEAYGPGELESHGLEELETISPVCDPILLTLGLRERRPERPAAATSDTPLLQTPHSRYTEAEIWPHPSLVKKQSIIQNVSEGTPLKRILTSLSKRSGGEGEAPGLRERARALATTLGRSPTLTGLELQYEREQQLFVEWLDSEFTKIDQFYKAKETDFLERFLALEDQLYQLQEHKIRLRLGLLALVGGDQNLAGTLGGLTKKTRSAFEVWNRFELPTLPRFKPPEQPEDAENGSADALGEGEDETGADVDHGDYVVRKPKVSYLTSRRMLKKAMLEYHRGLELLKSYRTVNRTAFRKMVKKFDKTTGSHVLPEYMSKINASYFSTSEILDNLFTRVEDLYSIYFENGNRKHAVEVLRSRESEQLHYGPLFLSGLLIGCSLPLLVLAIIKGLQQRGGTPEVPYMFQIWGGFLLATIMALLFWLNLLAWEKFKISYKFIFEFNPNDNLSPYQYILLPALSMAMVAFFGWFSFSDFWPGRLPAHHWPWFFIGLFLALFLWPFDHLYRSSRRWFQVALWRLLFSGFYPVEFRDFFLGDIFCSLTYTMGNISFFFCLYATDWRGVRDGLGSHCGSSRSRVMGFLSTLPSIWRFLQCWRRFCDSGDAFPHLANMLKYTVSGVYYMTLSIYRIDRSASHRAVFIVFAIINSVYSAIWDVFMDWSLMQAHSKHRLLRNDLAFKRPIYYYIAIITDVVLRFQWIFYALFGSQVEQSMVTSFCVALAEIIRRFIWIFFRMENEHCTNVKVFRASRDSPLPYPPARRKRVVPDLVVEAISNRLDEEAHHTAVSKPSGFLFKVSEVLGHAHMKDFQRRKPIPEAKLEESDMSEGDD